MYADDPITIALIHPSRLFGEGLARILEETPYKLALQATSFGVVPFEAFHPPGKLVFLVGGQSLTHIVETVRSLRGKLHSVSILVIGQTSEPPEVMLTLEAGADGFLRETITAQTLMTAIDLVIHDETVLPSEFVKAIASIGTLTTNEMRTTGVPVPRRNYAGNGSCEGENVFHKSWLSEREELILKDLIEGSSNKRIAQHLCITEATVKVHVKAILRKMRVKNRTQAAIQAVKYLATDEASPNAPANERDELINGHD